MLIEEFHEIDLPVLENGKWIVYAAGNKSIRLLSDAQLYENTMTSRVSHDGGLTYEKDETCEFDTEFDATACGLTYLLHAMVDEKERIEATMNDELFDEDDSSVMEFE